MLFSTLFPLHANVQIVKDHTVTAKTRFLGMRESINAFSIILIVIIAFIEAYVIPRIAEYFLSKGI